MKKNFPTNILGEKDPHTLKKLFDYLLKYKTRMILALIALILAKMANVSIPIILKEIVDLLSEYSEKKNLSKEDFVFIFPFTLIFFYGVMRFASTAFGELREIIFARVTQSAVRGISIKLYTHLHNLSLRFHLNKKTGSLIRDIERGVRGVSTMVNFTLYSIFPTIVEVVLVILWLLFNYDYIFSLITFTTLILYVSYTITITNWRTNLRRKMNYLDSKANSGAVESLLNFENVKYFNNEKYEIAKYDNNLVDWQEAAIKSQSSLAVLNIGQALIVALGITFIVWQAIDGVLSERLTLGDLVLINAFMIQLYLPLNFLGVLYREIKQSLADMEKLFGLMSEEIEVSNHPQSLPLKITDGRIVFNSVDFSYSSEHQIFKNLSFEIQAKKKTAIVGTSGSGKTTVHKLIYRFFDVNKGQIEIDGQEIKMVTQSSLRESIGIVPQDVILFNDTFMNNIKYGDTSAGIERLNEAIRSAHLEKLVSKLPEGVNTIVGERGMKLSGGEKQRVAIARLLLKNPKILIFDEATSSLDSETEKIIKSEINEISKGKTTIIIAHRLSTVIDADMIYVFNDGKIVEKGSHTELINKMGEYSKLWAMQAKLKEI